MVSSSILPACRAIPTQRLCDAFCCAYAPVALPRLRALHDRFLSAHDERAAPPYVTDLRFDPPCSSSTVNKSRRGDGYNPISELSLVSPTALFRGPETRTSGTASCGRAMFIRPMGTLNLLTDALAKIPRRSPVGHHPRRQRVLRSQLWSSGWRSIRGWLCHRHSAVRDDQTQVGTPAFLDLPAAGVRSQPNFATSPLGEPHAYRFVGIQTATDRGT